VRAPRDLRLSRIGRTTGIDCITGDKLRRNQSTDFIRQVPERSTPRGSARGGLLRSFNTISTSSPSVAVGAPHHRAPAFARTEWPFTCKSSTSYSDMSSVASPPLLVTAFCWPELSMITTSAPAMGFPSKPRRWIRACIGFPPVRQDASAAAEYSVWEP
jgi:hypothetical protein